MGADGVVTSCTSIDEAFLQGPDKYHICPYCGAKDNNGKSKTKGVISATPIVWIEYHLERCKKKNYHIKCQQKLKEIIARDKWVLHEQCGRCMVLAIENGLCLVENDHGRYVVAAGDVKYNTVSNCLETIDNYCFSKDQIAEIISYLMAKVNHRRIYPRVRIGDRVEFHLKHRTRLGLVKQVSKKHCVIHLEQAQSFEPQQIRLENWQVIGIN